MSTLPNFPWTSRSHAQADASQSAPSPTAEPVEAVAPEPMASSPQAPAAPTYVTRGMGGEGRVTSSPKPSVIRARERERIKAIVLSPNAATNPVAALELALETNLPATAAIGILNATVAASSSSSAPRRDLSRRMESVDVPAVGADAPSSKGTGNDPKDVASFIVRMGRVRRGEPVA